jgi:ribosome assembly protein SQT1
MIFFFFLCVCLFILNVAQEAVTQIRWHPTDPLIFSCSVDRTLRLWDGRNGENVRTWNAHTDAILAFDVTPYGFQAFAIDSGL